MKKRTRNMLIVLAGLVVVVVVAVAATRGKGDVATVTTHKVSFAPFTVKLPESGVVQIPHVETVPSLVAGNLGAIYVHAGQRVAQGQLLATIENPALDAQAAGSEADYQSSVANIATARVNEQNARVQYESQVATAKSNYDEARRVYLADVNLYSNKAIARNQLDTDQAKMVQAKVQYDQALQQLRLGAVTGYGQNSVQYAEAAARKSQIANAQNQQQLGFTHIVAPFSGTIQTVTAQTADPLRSLQPGDAVSAGQALFTIAESDHFIVRAQVDEQDIAQVRVGQKAIVSGEDFGTKTFPGHVASIAPTAQKSTDPSSTSKQVLTTIALEAPSPMLRDGMSADVDILTTDIARAMTVPNGAIVTSGKKKSVWLLRGGKLRKTAVNTGLSNETVTVVKSGLTPGDEIVALPLPTFKDGLAAKSAPKPKGSPGATLSTAP